MAARRIWLHCRPDFPAKARDALCARCQRDGLLADEAGPSAGSCGALLICDPAPAIVMLEELAKRSRRRVAVAWRSALLRGGWAQELLRAGADDVIAWDCCDRPEAAVTARLARWLDVEELLASTHVRGRFRGSSPALNALLRPAVEAAKFSSSPVLIAGRTGTGKELLARMIHDLDVRSAQGRFIVCDCTTIVPDLSGSEFFGHVRGAFTGAITAREGAFALADGGTLFLDEIGELPIRMQAELLRVIQEGTFKRVGSNEWLRTTFRLVCATNRDLATEVQQGRFREDLYYRIAGCILRMPTLQERREDIPALAEAFLAEAIGEIAAPPLDEAVREHLFLREYPGNIRELRQLVLRIGQRYVPPGPVTLGALPESELIAMRNGRRVWPDERWDNSVREALANGRGVAELRNAVADAAYRLVLADEDGDTGRAAGRLGVSQRAVQQYVRERGNGAAHVALDSDATSPFSRVQPGLTSSGKPDDSAKPLHQ